MEPSDLKEALPGVDVWRSATAISGAQCVMTSGVYKMPKWSAGSWDSLMLMLLSYPLLPFLMVQVRSGWTMWPVMEQRPDSSTALLVHWGYTTVGIAKMPE
jgi:hypothetical protein